MTANSFPRKCAGAKIVMQIEDEKRILMRQPTNQDLTLQTINCAPRISNVSDNADRSRSEVKVPFADQQRLHQEGPVYRQSTQRVPKWPITNLLAAENACCHNLRTANVHTPGYPDHGACRQRKSISAFLRSPARKASTPTSSNKDVHLLATVFQSVKLYSDVCRVSLARECAPGSQDCPKDESPVCISRN